MSYLVFSCWVWYANANATDCSPTLSVCVIWMNACMHVTLLLQSCVVRGVWEKMPIPPPPPPPPPTFALVSKLYGQPVSHTLIYSHLVNASNFTKCKLKLPTYSRLNIPLCQYNHMLVCVPLSINQLFQVRPQSWSWDAHKNTVTLYYPNQLWLKPALQRPLVVKMATTAIINHGLTTFVIGMTTGKHRETLTEQVWAAGEKCAALRHI